MNEWMNNNLHGEKVCTVSLLPGKTFKPQDQKHPNRPRSIYYWYLFLWHIRDNYTITLCVTHFETPLDVIFTLYTEKLRYRLSFTPPPPLCFCPCSLTLTDWFGRVWNSESAQCRFHWPVPSADASTWITWVNHMLTYDMEQMCRPRFCFLFFWLPPRRVCMEAQNIPAKYSSCPGGDKGHTYADPLADSTLVSLDSGSLRVEISHTRSECQ